MAIYDKIKSYFYFYIQYVTMATNNFHFDFNIKTKDGMGHAYWWSSRDAGCSFLAWIGLDRLKGVAMATGEGCSQRPQSEAP